MARQEEAVKQVVSISLGSSDKDYAFNTEFLGQQFTIKRLGTDGDLEKAAELLLRWDKEADAIGLGHYQIPLWYRPTLFEQNKHSRIRDLGAQVQTPVTIGSALRDVSFEWALRFIEYKFGTISATPGCCFFLACTVTELPR
jgi:hypothetical protein